MDTIDPTRFVLAFLFVVGLIGVLAIVLRRSSKMRKYMGGTMFHTNDNKGRIQVVEVMYVDAKRRLMLVRRDDTEHLLLLADGRELVIESDIRAPMMKPQENTGS